MPNSTGQTITVSAVYRINKEKAINPYLLLLCSYRDAIGTTSDVTGTTGQEVNSKAQRLIP